MKSFGVPGHGGHDHVAGAAQLDHQRGLTAERRHPVDVGVRCHRGAGPRGAERAPPGAVARSRPWPDRVHARTAADERHHFALHARPGFVHAPRLAACQGPDHSDGRPWDIPEAGSARLGLRGHWNGGAHGARGKASDSYHAHSAQHHLACLRRPVAGHRLLLLRLAGLHSDHHVPFGIASFRMAAYALWPFGKTIVAKARPRASARPSAT